MSTHKEDTPASTVRIFELEGIFDSMRKNRTHREALDRMEQIVSPMIEGSKNRKTKKQNGAGIRVNGLDPTQVLSRIVSIASGSIKLEVNAKAVLTQYEQMEQDILDVLERQGPYLTNDEKLELLRELTWVRHRRRKVKDFLAQLEPLRAVFIEHPHIQVRTQDIMSKVISQRDRLIHKSTITLNHRPEFQSFIDEHFRSAFQESVDITLD